MTALLAPPPAEVHADTGRCDADGIAAATWAVLTRSGELVLCDHHLRKHAHALEAAGYLVDPIEAP
jgi:hypothetical protein